MERPHDSVAAGMSEMGSLWVTPFWELFDGLDISPPNGQRVVHQYLILTSDAHTILPKERFLSVWHYENSLLPASLLESPNDPFSRTSLGFRVFQAPNPKP